MIRTRSRVVGMVLKGYPRLSETFVLREIRLLESLGLELRLFALRDPGERSVHDDVKRVRASVTYVPDDFTRSFGTVAAANLSLLRRHPGRWLGAAGHALRLALRLRAVAPLKRFLQAGYLAERELADSDVAHLYAHFAHDPTTVAFYAARLAGLTYSFSAHAKDIFTEDRAWLAEKVAGAVFATTCTEHNRDWLVRRAGGGGRVFRCYHGLELEHFAPPARRTPADAPRLLSVGRFVPKKGFDVLLEALARLRERGVRFQATIVGDGPMEGAMRETIRQRGLEGVVTLLRPMPQRELLEHFGAADAFVLACQVEADGDRDGIPNVFVEAMAMEVPVVSTRVSGIPELIDDGVDGVLVAERDPEALARALADLFDDPERARRIARAGRARVAARFDSRANVQMIHRALEAALSERGVEPAEERHVVVG